MNGNLGRDKLWNQQIWGDIDNAVRDEVGRVRVAQKVFPCTLVPNWQQVPKDQLSTSAPNILKIDEGQTKPFVEIWVEFSLTQSQVENEENLHTGRTLARMAANKIAAAEDTLLFQGRARAVGALPAMSATPATSARPEKPALIKEVNADSLGDGLLGTNARPSITVSNSNELIGKITSGIAKLKTSQNYGPYGLILPAQKFADAYTPITGTTVTPADSIIPLVAGGFYGTGCLPDKDGLLVSLGGEPTTIYVGIDATTAFTQVEPNGIYRFRVFERIQFVERDPAALLRVKFA
jgi:uncharacterized linocin/CFP29 family protein